MDLPAAQSGLGREVRIRDVADKLGESTVTIRLWTDAFSVPCLRVSGQRSYGIRELIALREVQKLLRDEGLTWAGAKKRLGLIDNDTHRRHKVSQ